MDNLNGGCIVMTLVFLVALVIFGPMITIWSVNTLFGLAIPTTLKTWFATLWLVGTTGIGTALKTNKS